MDQDDPGADDPGADDPDMNGRDDSSACLDGITGYAASGPFRYRTASTGRVKLWIPELPSGCRAPIVHLANGTSGTCSNYTQVLEHMASHGFVAACFEDTRTGAGTQCVDAIAAALAELPDLTTMKAGAAGHGTSGGAALLCARLAREKWGDALRIAAHGSAPDLAGLPSDWADQLARVSAPVAIVNGSEDFLVSEGTAGRIFDALDPGLEAYWYEGVGAPHIPVPVRWMSESMVAWFRLQLLDDRAACRHFHALPDSADWDMQAQHNPRACE